MNIKNSLNMVGYGLTVFYILILASIFNGQDRFDFGLALLAFLIIGALVMASRKPWGRKIVLIGSVVAIVYFGWQAVYAQTDKDSAIGLGMVSVSLAVIVFYNLAGVKKYFQVRENLPAWTILIIDDDKTLLKLLKVNFERCRLSILTAETGEAGLVLAEQARPDLIILDVILPKMKGRTVCAKLKENPRTKEIPVVFLTAKNSPDDVRAELEAGAFAHITKPVNFQQLLAQVKKILSA